MRHFIIAIIILTLAACQFKNSEDQLFFLELVDDVNSEESQALMERVGELVCEFKYGALRETAPDGDFLMRLDLEQTNSLPLADHAPILHRFLPFSDYEEGISPEPYKIRVSYQPPNKEGQPNINIVHYQRLGHPDWMSRYNPGNFRFDPALDNQQLAEQIADLIVRLTFH